MATTKTKTKEKELELSPFANWMLFVSVVLVIGCVIGTAFVCRTIQSIGIQKGDCYEGY